MDTAIFFLLIIAVLSLCFAIFKHFSILRNNIDRSDNQRSNFRLRILSLTIIAFVPLLTIILNIMISPLSWNSIFQPDRDTSRSRLLPKSSYTSTPLTIYTLTCTKTLHPTPTQTPEPTSTLTPTNKPTSTFAPIVSPTISKTRINISPNLYLDENSSPDNILGEINYHNYYDISPEIYEGNFTRASVYQIGEEEWIAVAAMTRIYPFDEDPHPNDYQLQQHYIQVWNDHDLKFTSPIDYGYIPKRFFRYDDHWIFWYGYDWAGPGRIVQDGILLNDLYDYDDAFSLFLLDGKPLFFFQRNDQYGISYNNQEVLLPYENIVQHPICCGPGKNRNPRGTNLMVGFYTQMEDSSYQYVEIGLK